MNQAQRGYIAQSSSWWWSMITVIIIYFVVLVKRKMKKCWSKTFFFSSPLLRYKNYSSLELQVPSAFSLFGTFEFDHHQTSRHSHAFSITLLRKAWSNVGIFYLTVFAGTIEQIEWIITKSRGFLQVEKENWTIKPKCEFYRHEIENFLQVYKLRVKFTRLVLWNYQF